LQEESVSFDDLFAELASDGPSNIVSTATEVTNPVTKVIDPLDIDDDDLPF